MSRLVEVMLGEGFYLYPTVIDAFNSSVYTPGYNIQLNNERFSFGGHQDRNINGWKSEFYIKGKWTENVEHVLLSIWWQGVRVWRFFN